MYLNSMGQMFQQDYNEQAYAMQILVCSASLWVGLVHINLNHAYKR